MSESITVLEVKKTGNSGITVTFSDGTSGKYSAALLTSLQEPSKLRIPYRDRFWVGESK